MAASDEKIHQVVQSYVELVATGKASEIADLYADGATVEDPIGSDVLTTREQIEGFYATLEPLDQATRLLTARVGGGEAAFHFEIVTTSGDATYTLSPIDVMTFDDDGLVTSMKAYWGPSDMVVGTVGTVGTV